MKDKKFNLLIVGRTDGDVLLDELEKLSIPRDCVAFTRVVKKGETPENIEYIQSKIDETYTRYNVEANEHLKFLQARLNSASDDIKSELLNRIHELEAAINENSILTAKGVELLYSNDSHEKRLMLDAVEYVEKSKQKINSLSFDDTTALGAIRKNQRDGTPFDAILIVGHHYTRDACVDPARDFPELVANIPADVPILFVGQTARALEAGLRQGSIISERLPPMAMAIYPKNGSVQFEVGGQPVPIAGEGNFNHPEVPSIELGYGNKATQWERVAQLINGSGADLTADENETVALSLYKLIKIKVRPDFLPDDHRKQSQLGK